jgi:pimeloyl-ACP methyl ester carboxylesterase
MEKIVSRDGTPIAYWTSGRGPALVLVHGTTADHTRWQGVRPLLEPHVTVCAMDRRGRGGSGDAATYSLAQEAQDVAAVVDAVADAAGRAVDVFGHSFGALCALEAALLTDAVRRLVLYEPPVQAVVPETWLVEAEDLLAQGRQEEVVVALLAEFAGLPPDQIARAKADVSWPGRIAAAHTIVRESRAETDLRFEPARFAGLRPPTLLLTGTESPRELIESTDRLAAALPGVRVRTMHGQGHVAMLTDPHRFVDELLRFLHPAGAVQG